MAFPSLHLRLGKTIEELKRSVEATCPICNLVNDGEPIKGMIVRGPYTKEKDRVANPAK
jgi:hypothetical protein